MSSSLVSSSVSSESRWRRLTGMLSSMMVALPELRTCRRGAGILIFIYQSAGMFWSN